MTYQINPNAKNVWIRDNADTIDLSVQTDADTVYLSNGRTIEQELGEGSMVSNIAIVDSAVSKIIDETLDGAYESCIFEGKTKWIDNTTQEILDTFDSSRNLSLIDVKMPILHNVGKNLFDHSRITKNKYITSLGVLMDSTLSNISDYIKVFEGTTYKLSTDIHDGRDRQLVYFDSNKNAIAYVDIVSNTRSITPPKGAHYIRFAYCNLTSQVQVEYGETTTTYEDYKTNILTTSDEVVLRKIGEVKDTYNALTGEYVQCVGEREYQTGDENNLAVITDMTKTQYILLTPTITIVDPIGIPFAYADGHVVLESGYSGQSLLPTLKYSTVVNRTGQIIGIGKTLLKQEKQLTDLEKMLIQGVIELDYNNTLMTLDLEIDEVI